MRSCPLCDDWSIHQVNNKPNNTVMAFHQFLGFNQVSYKEKLQWSLSVESTLRYMEADPSRYLPGCFESPSNSVDCHQLPLPGAAVCAARLQHESICPTTFGPKSPIVQIYVFLLVLPVQS